jgi:diguanylate cyclase (GGDEF)-like protein
MPIAALPARETERLAALHSYEVLDTACEAAFDNIAHLAAELTDCPISLVSLIDADRQWFKARVGLETKETPREHAFCAHAILNPGKLMVVPDSLQDPRFVDNPLVEAGPKIRFYAGMPLVNPEGAVLGTLCIIDRKPRQITEAERITLGRLAHAVTTTLELRRAMNRIRDLALIDILTGVPNRAALIQAIEKSVARQTRQGAPFSLLYLDLDGFKAINDAHGHAEGDAALREVASILTDTLRVDDTVGRLGGDEFAALLAYAGADAATVAERLRSSVESRMSARGWPVTASIGVKSFATPPIGAHAALAAADRLMYAAKAAGKNQVRAG